MWFYSQNWSRFRFLRLRFCVFLCPNLSKLEFWCPNFGFLGLKVSQISLDWCSGWEWMKFQDWNDSVTIGFQCKEEAGECDGESTALSSSFCWPLKDDLWWRRTVHNSFSPPSALALDSTWNDILVTCTYSNRIKPEMSTFSWKLKTFCQHGSGWLEYGALSLSEYQFWNLKSGPYSFYVLTHYMF